MRLLNLFQSTLILVFVRREHRPSARLDISADGGLGELPYPVQPAVRHLTVLSHQAGRHEIPVRPAKGLAGHLGPHLTESSLVSNYYIELIGSVSREWF